MMNQEALSYYNGDHYCPLYQHVINGSVCYETVMAYGHFLKKDAVPEMKEVVDLEQGKKICDACPGSKIF